MKYVELIMGMPITVEIVDSFAMKSDFESVFSYFHSVDKQFSPYKAISEVSRINNGEIKETQYSEEIKEILTLAEQTKKETRGYFNVWHKGIFNPSGIVKGWAIYNAAKILEKKGFSNFYIDAGGDIEVRGKNKNRVPWRIGIRNPFAPNEIIKTVGLSNCGIATSGTYIRGQHIYNPHCGDDTIEDIVSFTVIGEDIYEADRFATAAFAMGKEGISFIASIPHLEGYMIDLNKIAIMTDGFESFVI